MEVNQQNSKAATVAYLTIIGTVIAIFMNQDENKSEFASFHVRQALGIFISFFMLGILVSSADSWMATTALYLFFFILWIYGFTGALNNEKREVPLLGAAFQKWFSSL
ncbi:MAG: hypothetical protein H6584_01115 [Flavobacteriales bacterium]|nr:hypothetical protein [Flavobacteriales bacterium]